MNCFSDLHMWFMDITCQIPDNIVFVAGLIGGGLISLVFFLKQNMMQQNVDKFIEAYFIRTCMFQIRGILSNEHKRVTVDEDTRIKYVRRLKSAIKKFHLKQEVSIYNILSLVNKHPKIIPTHDHKICLYCPTIIKKITEYLDANPNPFE